MVHNVDTRKEYGQKVTKTRPINECIGSGANFGNSSQMN